MLAFRCKVGIIYPASVCDFVIFITRQFKSLIVRGRKLLRKQFPVVDIDLGSPLSLALVIIGVSCSFVISSYDSISAGCVSSFDSILCRRFILKLLPLKSRGSS